MAYDLNDLQLFLQVVDHGSITEGAKRSHMSLASASARVSAMEKALGAPLLTRHRRGVLGDLDGSEPVGCVGGHLGRPSWPPSMRLSRSSIQLFTQVEY